MKSKTLVRAARTLAVALPTLALAMSVAADGPQGSGAPNHAAGPKHRAQNVVSWRDIARISYPDAEVARAQGDSSKENTLRPRSLLIVQPRRLVRDGIYIWRDAEGVWNLQRVSRSEISISGAIIAESEIQTVSRSTWADNGIALAVTGGETTATISLPAAFESDESALRFKVTGAYVEFDLRVHGRADPSRIHIGSRGMNPAAVPFRLENRPIEVQNPTTSAHADHLTRLSSRPGQIAAQIASDGASKASSRGGSAGGAGTRRRTP